MPDESNASRPAGTAAVKPLLNIAEIYENEKTGTHLV